MKKPGQRSKKYRILDPETGHYFSTDWSSKAMHRNQISLYAEVAPEDRHKLIVPETYKKGIVILRETLDCKGCGKSLECAEMSGTGVTHSKAWLCKKCFKGEKQQRRNYNKRKGLFRSNPNRLRTPHWPQEKQKPVMTINLPPSV